MLIGDSLHPVDVLRNQAEENAGTLRTATLRGRSLWRNHAFLLRSCLFFAALAAGGFAGRWFVPAASRTAPSRVEQVTHYVPISLGPPNPESFLNMAIDGDRVLTSVMVNGRPRLSAINVDTGEV